MARLLKDKKGIEITALKEALYLLLGVLIVLLILFPLIGKLLNAIYGEKCGDETTLNSFYRLVEKTSL